MKRILKTLKKHHVIEVIITSLIVMLIYALPHIIRFYALASEGLPYLPLSLSIYFDEINVTGPRLHEILDGTLRIADIDIYEHMHGPSFMPMLPPLILAPITLITKSVNATIIIAESTLPGVFAIILYLLGRIITSGHHKLSIMFTFIVSLFPRIGLHITPTNLNQLKQLIANLLPWQHNLWRDRLGMSQMESFIPDFLIFGPAIIFLFLAIKKQQKKWFILFGIFLGLMFYTYVFHWMFLVVVCGIYFFYALWRKNWFTIRWLLFAGLIALVLSSYYFYHYALIAQLPQANLIKNAVWIEYSHMFRLSELKHFFVLLGLSAIVWKIAQHQKDRISALIISFCLAGIIVLNIQVITGFNIQPDHWPVRTNMFAIAIALLYITKHTLTYLKKHKKIYYSFIIALTVLTVSQITGGLHSQYAYTQSNYHAFTFDQELYNQLNNLNNTINTNDVILSPRLSIHYFIPTYTKGKIYLPRAINSISPIEERFERLAISARLFGIPNENVYELFDKQKNNIVKTRTSINDFDSQGLLYFFSGAALPRQIDGYKQKQARYQLFDEYRQSLTEQLEQKPNFSKSMLDIYKLDYIFVDPQSAQYILTDLDNYTFLEKIHDENEYKIYRVIKETNEETDI